MRILKLPWLCHEEQKKKFEIYSLSINADGTRMASGGLDGQVRIWSIDTILRFQHFDPLQSQSSTPALAITATTTKKDNKLSETKASDVDMPDKSLCRPLCSMARHTGAVTTVKFSPSGRFLATGSDDRVVLIWEKDEEFTQRPKAFGETEAELEHWTVRKRLVAHDNDIQGIAWAPDSSILITVGLDRAIVVWNGSNFEKIKRFDVHNSHVKGVVFDPANKYFATASDDRSVLIFRYHKTTASNDMTFSIELSVTKPFKGSPLTSYFRRLSWSPDGQHIAVPNATNGPVTSVAIINRGDWNSDISLIGHSSPCEVASFSPRLYDFLQSQKQDQQQRDKPDGKKNKKPKLCSVVATAGQDRALAIWKTSTTRPVLVANDICFKTISDMAWSPDGRTLFLSSLDGTITVLFFEENELGPEIPLEQNDSYLYRYGGDRENMVFPESVEQLKLEEKASKIKSYVIESKMDRLMNKADGFEKNAKIGSTSRSGVTTPTKQQAKTIDEEKSKVSKPVTMLSSRKKLQQTISITKEGKKRVAPMLMSANTQPKLNNNEFAINPVANASFSKELDQTRKDMLSSSLYKFPKSGVKSLVSGIRERHIDVANQGEDLTVDDDTVTMRPPLTPHTNSGGNNSSGSVSSIGTNFAGGMETRGKKASTKKKMDIDYPDYMCEIVRNSLQGTALLNYSTYSVRNTSTLVVLSQSRKVGREFQSNLSLHIQNNYEYDKDNKIDKEFAKLPTRVVSTDTKGRKRFEIFLPHSIVNAIGNEELKVWIMVSDQGSIFLISVYGKLVYPRIDIGANICVLKNYGRYLMVVTNTGLMYLWDIVDFKMISNNISLAPFINTITVKINQDDKEHNKSKGNREEIIVEDESQDSKRVITSCELNSKGVPIFVLDDGDAYAWSVLLFCWVKLSAEEFTSVATFCI